MNAPVPTDAMLQRQIELEIEMQGLGATRYWRMVDDAMTKVRAPKVMVDAGLPEHVNCYPVDLLEERLG